METLKGKVLNNKAGFFRFTDAASAAKFKDLNEFTMKFSCLERVSGQRPWMLRVQMENRMLELEAKNIRRHFAKNLRMLVLQASDADIIVRPGAFDVPLASLDDAKVAFNKYNKGDINGHKIASLSFAPVTSGY